MTLDDATISQNRSAEPDKSTWLSANAGSGKTRVLTDRVARLLLGEVPPQNILCLTYTKAAASEMQNRLFERLGDWAMKSDAELASDLFKMGEQDTDAPERLADARRLFARAIETPGGLRIQTIHSFCASLLRRFPLEAGVSPALVEMDDLSAAHLRADCVEHIAETDPGAMNALAEHFSGDDLDLLTKSIVSRKASFGAAVSREDVLTWFDAPSDLNMTSVLRTAFSGDERAVAQAVVEAAAGQSKTYTEFAAELLALDLEQPDLAVLKSLYKLFLYASGDSEGQSKSANFPQERHKKAVEAFAPCIEELHAFMDRVADAKVLENTLLAAEKTHALHRFARVFIAVFEQRKAAQALLDFDDLIDKARALLSNPGVADWVLYRLDGGLDHILVDEAQDTSPAQWNVIEALAREFSAGLGAGGERARTIFVVGDKKQSIYSFQGADPAGFDQMRDLFRSRLEGAGEPFQRRELEFSFRSSKAILDVVDCALGTVKAGEIEIETSHRAFHDALPGRVDLWPAVDKSAEAEQTAWYDPVDRIAPDHHDVILANQIAAEIKRSLGSETIPLPDGTRRGVKAGDILILVRRRSTLFEEIIRACKSLELPVAGADRLKLGGELAVKDLAALLTFLATPEDDLSLAAALRSPLFGWSEGELYDLAANRGDAYLWSALRKAENEHPRTFEILGDLRSQTDFLRPFDLIERILSRHDGRRRLLARLGAEAEDGIDQLLSQALAYERRDIPSLTGFLTWLETDDVEVKRQMDNAGDQIRVMTVHGAKGLEAPIVILPDTCKRQNRIRDEVVLLDNGHPVWKTSSGAQPPAMVAALDRMRAAQEAEDLRLLYVAMTRAETWLIIAAAGDVGDDAQSWHGIAQAALEHLRADPLITPTGAGLRHLHGDWTRGDLASPPPNATEPLGEPDWLYELAPTPTVSDPISPSDLGGAKSLPGETGERSQEESMEAGTQVHLLLEHLSKIDPDKWEDVAALLLADAGDEDRAKALEIATRVLSDPKLRPLFDPPGLSEVDFTVGVGERVMNGSIDRLVLTPDRVLAIDIKTNRIVPKTPEKVPEGVLRQMGAYDHALRQIYPDRRIETAILWTTGPSLMLLPHEIVRQAWLDYSTS